MSTSTSNRLVRGMVAALATLAVLTGCASGGTEGSSRGDTSAPAQEYAQEPAPEDGAGGSAQDSEQAESDPQAPGDSTAVADRAIITTTSASIRVEDVPGSVGMLEQLVSKHDGRIEARTERTTDQVPEAQLTVRIPAANHDAFIAELKELGEVVTLESNAEDVTLEQVDLESRISSLESSIASLEAMLEAATTVEDMLEVEGELSDRQAELQSLQAQHEVLSEDVALSTVHVNFSSDAEPEPIDEEPTGFFAGLGEGWNDFVESLNDFITDFGYALPGLALLIIILALIWLFVVRPIWRRIRAATAQKDAGAEFVQQEAHPSGQAGPEGEPESPAGDQPVAQPAAEHGSGSGSGS
ncbi:MAG: DUF4349 domain-containing protein, partial [Leucobacter sp.]